MTRFVNYYARFRDVRGDLNGLPSWGRSIVFIAALPGIALVTLSFLALVVSIVALLFLTIPAYMFLRAVTGADRIEQSGLIEVSDRRRSDAKHVDVTVRDPGQSAPDEVNGE